MSDIQLTIEGLRRWSQILLWISVTLPLLGGLAAGARYYVERYEKQLSSRLTTSAIQKAQSEAETARQEVSVLKLKSGPRRLSLEHRAALLAALAPLKGTPIAFSCKMMDGESCTLAEDLLSVFRAAGCQVPELAKTSLNDLPGQIAIVEKGAPDPRTAQLIITALNANGLRASIETISENSVGVWYPNVVHVVVGSKGP